MADEMAGDLSPVLIAPFTISSKRCRAYFRPNVLMWKMETSPFESNTIPVSDIIAVDYGSKNTCGHPQPRANGSGFLNPSFPDLSATDYAATSLVIHYARHVGNNKWRIFSVTLQHVDAKEVALWFVTLEKAVKREGRPRSFLVFVNPFCGKRKGSEVYNKTVKPILELAKVEATVVVTQSGTCARDHILTSNVDEYDGVMAVGGDGTVSEIINSLIARSVREGRGSEREGEGEGEVGKVKVPVAIIPCGSTNCIAYCLNGTEDHKTSAIFGILGCRQGLDVCSVHSQKGLRRYFLGLLAYGFLGDVLKESEKHRWMGPRRYDYAGFLQALKNRRYYCEVSMVLSRQAPGVGPKCCRGCETCSEGAGRTESRTRYREDSLSAIRSELNLREARGPERRLTVRGKYFIIGCANLSCACERSPNGFSPYSHVGDGSMDVLLMKPRSVLDVGKLVLRSKSKTRALSDLPFVEIYKAREVSVRALDKNLEAIAGVKEDGRCLGASVWNCDGEVVCDSNIRVRNHRQLVQVFTRRMTPSAAATSSSCWNCYNCSRGRIGEGSD